MHIVLGVIGFLGFIYGLFALVTARTSVDVIGAGLGFVIFTLGLGTGGIIEDVSGLEAG